MSAPDRPAGLVDVHCHFTTESYIAEAEGSGQREPDGNPEGYWPHWTAEQHLDLMGRAGIDRSILSLSSPGVWFGDAEQSRRLAREVNVAGAEEVRRHPDRFGLLAILPLPDVDAALAEIAFALDDLQADGVVLMSNAGGRYPGSAATAPVLDELDRRGAVVLIHPTSCVGHEELALGRPRPMLEFLFDTARSVVDLVLGGAAEAHPDLRVVVPHAGGVLPLLADRIELFRSAVFHEPADRTSTAELLSRMYFDLAGTPTGRQLAALRSIVPVEHLVYGSDYAWTRAEPVLQALEVIDDALSGPTAGDWRELTTRNAHELLGRRRTD